MKDKDLRKLAIKSGKRVNREIYFSKKKRKEWKRTFLKSQKAILENEDFSIKPVLKEEYGRRTLATSILAYTVSGLEVVEKAEEYDKTIYLTNCKFILSKRGKSMVFKATFLKPLLDKKKRTSYLCFPQGFPKTSKKKAFILKDGKEFLLRRYKELDSGAFKQKILNHGIIGLTFLGKKANYDFKLTLINEKNQSYWATKLFTKKRS